MSWKTEISDLGWKDIPKNEEEDLDVEILLKNGKKIKVNKRRLATKSQYFKNLWKYENKMSVSLEMFSDTAVENTVNILCNGGGISCYNMDALEVFSVASFLQSEE